MPVPFGFGVGDFVAVGTLAWNVYKSCKAAPGSFDSISAEVLSLHALLKEGEETLFTRALPPARAERLQIIKDGCYRVLVDLQRLVEKYESLGTQTKRTWDRMRWGNEDIAEIRARLTSNITILSAYISTSQISVETKLEKFIDEFHQGKREGSIVSLQTVDSLSADDRAVWRTIRKELEEIGISVAAFDANRDFIFDWFIRAVGTGAFEEENEDESDEESNLSDERESQSSSDQDRQDIEQQVEDSELEPLGNNNKDQQLVRTQLLGSAPDKEVVVAKRGHKNSEQILASERTAPRNNRGPTTRFVSEANSSAMIRALDFRVTAVLAGLSRPRRRLIKAVATNDFSKALNILKDDASFQLLDSKTLNKALWKACCQVGGSDQCRLIAELIAKGSDVNYRTDEDSGDSNWIGGFWMGQTSLWNCVQLGSIDSVRLLVENGADVNHMDNRPFSRGGQECEFAPRAALTRNIALLRLLLSAGVNVNAQYAIRSITLPYLRDSRGKVTLIQEAAMLDAVPAIEALLDHGAKIDSVSPRRGTALMAALSRTRTDAARLLLARGADPNLRIRKISDSNPLRLLCPRTPIEAAIIGGNALMLKTLLDRGAESDDSTMEFSRTIARLVNRSHENIDREIQQSLNTYGLSSEIISENTSYVQ